MAEDALLVYDAGNGVVTMDVIVPATRGAAFEWAAVDQSPSLPLTTGNVTSVHTSNEIAKCVQNISFQEWIFKVM